MLALLMVLSFAYADIQAPGPAKRPVDIPHGRVKEPSRAVPYHHFSRNPLPIMLNYYDYMIGSYSGLPLRLIPERYGGGYFMVYHGRREAGSTRRVFYTCLDAMGNVLSNNEITNEQRSEGFPTLVVDYLSGKPMYAWHTNVDVDPELEVKFTADAYLGGFPGLFHPGQTIADNPTEVTAPNGTVTTDNEFIWPMAVIGPSPNEGQRRVYISMTNAVSHSLDGLPSENPLIAYADVDSSMIASNISPTWNYTSVPTYDLWNVDASVLRRPFTTICADGAGNIYYIGYQVSADTDGNELDEPDVHVLKCDNYGQGTWTTYSRSGHIPAWNPPGPDGEFHFVDDDGNPYEPGEIRWSVLNSNHSNAVVDNYGRLHFPALWGLTTNEGTFYPAMQYLKQLVFDPATGEIDVQEIYPRKHPDNTADYECYHPWDTEPPWGEAEYIWEDGEYYLDIESSWPFCHWDQSAHENGMMFHYNNIKMSTPNSEGMTVVVWQDSNRARMYNQFNDTEYANFANVPEIMILTSVDNGITWRGPISINSVDHPELAGLIPMYVYPVDEVINLGIHNGHWMGRVGIMFYDDFTWGSYANQPPYHNTNDGGQTMFMELDISFAEVDSDDPMADAPGVNILKGNYPNPFNPTTTISYTMPASGDVKLNVYNLRGQLVRSLVNEAKTAGSHKVVWDGKDDRGNTMASGIYLYRLETGKHSETRKMMLMK